MIRNSFYAAIGHLTGLLNDLYNISESRKGKGRRVQKEIPPHPPQVLFYFLKNMKQVWQI